MEVWANSINLPFHFALLAALMTAIPIEKMQPKWLFRVLLAASGLTGIPANFVAPVFVAVALKERQRERWIQAGIISLSAVLQVVLLATTHTELGDRQLSLDPMTYWLALLTQQLISPLFGTVADPFGGMLQNAFHLHKEWLLFCAVLSVPYVLLMRYAVVTRDSQVGALLASCGLLSVLSILGAIGDTKQLISFAGDGRYLFAPNAVLALSVLIASNRTRNGLLAFFVAVLFVSSCFRIGNSYVGPSWRSEYRQVASGAKSVLGIWPTGWQMAVVCRGGAALDCISGQSPQDR
jgi:hypothetical protein